MPPPTWPGAGRRRQVRGQRRALGVGGQAAGQHHRRRQRAGAGGVAEAVEGQPRRANRRRGGRQPPRRGNWPASPTLPRPRWRSKPPAAQVEVDQAAEENLAALVGYTHVHAPYDGIVVVRNANTGDYVEPRYGDASAPVGGYAAETRNGGHAPLHRGPHRPCPRLRRCARDGGQLCPARHQGPRPHPGRRRRGVPGDGDANLMGPGLPQPYPAGRNRPAQQGWEAAAGHVRLWRGRDRTPRRACAANGRGRRRSATRPAATCYEDGKAMRTPVQTGINDGKYVEVVKKR